MTSGAQVSASPVRGVGEGNLLCPEVHLRFDPVTQAFLVAANSSSPAQKSTSTLFADAHEGLALVWVRGFLVSLGREFLLCDPAPSFVGGLADGGGQILWQFLAEEARISPERQPSEELRNATAEGKPWRQYGSR